MSGYVRLHRSLLGHPAFRNEAETMAFAWLIAKAAWRAARVRYKGHVILLGRGEVAISIRDMAVAHDRDKAWIERLWRRLKAEAMIETRNETGVTIVSICNYNQFQSESESGETPSKPRGEIAGETVVRQERDTEQRREEGKKEEKAAARAKPAEPELPADVRAIMQAVTFAFGVPGDLGYLKRWYEAGAELESDIIPVLKREAAELERKGHGRPKLLRIFDGPVRQKLATDQAEIERLRASNRRWEAVEQEERERAAAAGRG